MQCLPLQDDFLCVPVYVSMCVRIRCSLTGGLVVIGAVDVYQMNEEEEMGRGRVNDMVKPRLRWEHVGFLSNKRVRWLAVPVVMRKNANMDSNQSSPFSIF